MEIETAAGIEATNRKKEAGLALANAESGLRQSNLEISKAELQVLQQQEQVLGNQNQRLGAMGPGSQRRMAAIATQVKKSGYDSLTLRQRELVRGFAPEYAKKEDERRGELNPNRKLFQEVGFFLPGTQKERRQEIDRKQQEIRIEARFDQNKLNNDVKKVMDNLAQAFTEALAMAVTNAINKVKIGHQTLNANKGG